MGIMKKNYFLVKYENLVKNPLEEFTKVTNFISKVLRVKFSNEQIENAVKNENVEKFIEPTKQAKN